MALVMWTEAVFSLMNRSAPISRLVWPVATSERTSHSRVVRATTTPSGVVTCLSRRSRRRRRKADAGSTGKVFDLFHERASTDLQGDAMGITQYRHRLRLASRVAEHRFRPSELSVRGLPGLPKRIAATGCLRPSRLVRPAVEPGPFGLRRGQHRLDEWARTSQSNGFLGTEAQEFQAFQADPPCFRLFSWPPPAARQVSPVGLCGDAEREDGQCAALARRIREQRDRFIGGGSGVVPATLGNGHGNPADQDVHALLGRDVSEHRLCGSPRMPRRPVPGGRGRRRSSGRPSARSHGSPRSNSLTSCSASVQRPRAASA